MSYRACIAFIAVFLLTSPVLAQEKTDEWKILFLQEEKKNVEEKYAGIVIEIKKFQIENQKLQEEVKQLQAVVENLKTEASRKDAIYKKESDALKEAFAGTENSVKALKSQNTQKDGHIENLNGELGKTRETLKKTVFDLQEKTREYTELKKKYFELQLSAKEMLDKSDELLRKFR